jgi:hypothetical protein
MADHRAGLGLENFGENFGRTGQEKAPERGSC